MSVLKEKSLLTIGHGEITALLSALEENGVTLELLKKIRSSKRFAKLIGEFIAGDGLLTGLLHRDARKMFGDYFFGPEEWAHYFGMKFSSEELQSALSFPWSTKFLGQTTEATAGDSVAKSHFCAWIPPNFKIPLYVGGDFLTRTGEMNGDATNSLKQILETSPASGWHLFLNENRVCDITTSGMKPRCGYEHTPLFLSICHQVLCLVLNGSYQSDYMTMCKDCYEENFYYKADDKVKQPGIRIFHGDPKTHNSVLFPEMLLT